MTELQRIATALESIAHELNAFRTEHADRCRDAAQNMEQAKGQADMMQGIIKKFFTPPEVNNELCD